MTQITEYNSANQIEFSSKDFRKEEAFAALFTKAYNKEDSKRGQKELTYIHIVYSYYSGYRQYRIEERKEKAMQLAELPEGYVFSNVFIKAIECYEKIQKQGSPELYALTVAISLGTAQIDFLASIATLEELKKEKQGGGLIHDPTKVLQWVKELRKLVAELNQASNQFEATLKGSERIYAGAEKGELEDSESFEDFM